MSKWLSKSDYVYGYLISPALLWLRKNDPTRLPPVEQALQLRFDMANELHELARQKFGKGVLVDGDTLASIEQSQEVMKQTKDGGAVYEAAMLADERLYARADIVVKNGDVWDMYEVKSATGYHKHPEYLLDLAFQKIVWERAGIKVGKCNLVLVNTHYERKGELEPKKLFYVVDVTEEVENLLPNVEFDIKEALAIIDNPKCPDTSLLKADNIKTWLPIFEHLEGSLPHDSIFRLARITTDLARLLDKAGVKSIKEIEHPDQFKLSPAQRGQWVSLLEDKPTIHDLKIAHFLSKLQYPLYFLDYETVMPAVPLWEGTRPYQTLPFQYSIQVVEKPGDAPRELKFLHQGKDNPAPLLLKQLKKDIGASGSVVVWSDYEAGVHAGLAAHYPEYKEFLMSVNKRIFDLMQVFKRGFYVDSAFFGSASIKKVLPVIVPELSYKDLEISEGQTASFLWQHTAEGKLEGAEAEKVFHDLEVYCGQDTMAMVKIYDFLRPIAENAPGAPVAMPF